MGTRLAFANGPYSAKAIEQRVGAPNPALHNADGRGHLFSEVGAVEYGGWELGPILAGGGHRRRRQSQCGNCAPQLAPLLLLWVPLLFYALSIAYGSVPLHVYTWWPFATFNQRYGLQLLPMFAVSAGVLTASVFLLGAGRRHGGKLAALIFALMVVSYASVWKAEPAMLAGGAAETGRFAIP